MTDLDELRRALRAQESLAPDPVDVLAAATRRIRRRRTAGVAAVTLTVTALGAAAVVVLGRGPATVPPATLASSPAVTQPPAAEKVPPAAPAISLEDRSWELLMWSSRPHYAALHYGQARQYAFEIDVRDGAAPAGALATKPSAAGQLPNPKSVMWRDGPDRWIWARTTKPVTAGEMLALLAKIGTTPPVVASPLKFVQLPGGQQVGSFTSEPETNTVVLCPGDVLGKAPLDSRCFSLTVSLTSHFADSSFPEDPLPVHQHRRLGAYTVEVNSSPANRQAASTLLNSVQLNR